MLTLAACSGQDASDGTGYDAGGQAPQDTAEEAAEEPEDRSEETDEETDDEADDEADDAQPMGEATVEVAETSHGQVLVDAEGLTLYMFDPDEQGESTCYDECATSWPPLLVDGEPTAGDGADDSLLGTTTRTDGAVQVTYGDWPVYYFAMDAAPGDVNGQAVNDVWWVLDAEGEPVRG